MSTLHGLLIKFFIAAANKHPSVKTFMGALKKDLIPEALNKSVTARSTFSNAFSRFPIK